MSLERVSRDEACRTSWLWVMCRFAWSAGGELLQARVTDVTRVVERDWHEHGQENLQASLWRIHMCWRHG